MSHDPARLFPPTLFYLIPIEENDPVDIWIVPVDILRRGGSQNRQTAIGQSFPNGARLRSRVQDITQGCLFDQQNVRAL